MRNADKSTDEREEHLLKKLGPTLVRLTRGLVSTVVREEHPLKKASPMVVTVFRGLRSMVVREVQ